MKGEPDTYAVNDVISNTTANEESFSMEKEDEDEEKNEEKIREDEEVISFLIYCLTSFELLYFCFQTITYIDFEYLVTKISIQNF